MTPDTFELLDTVSAGSIEEAYEIPYARGWTDGLPVVPPTETLVRRGLAYLGVDPNESIGKVPPRQGLATYEKIVANCVMAGCLPEHMPVVIAALRAMFDERFTLGGVQGTTSSMTPLVIVSGPIVKELEFNSRWGVFGGGSRSNAAVGRAVRLIMWNIGGGYPGLNDMATHGHPGKYAFCIAEDDEWNPWEPLHVERGLEAGDSAVTVVATDAPTQIGPGTSNSTPDEVFTVLADAMASSAVINQSVGGDMVLVMGPLTAQSMAAWGYDKDGIRAELQKRARRSAEVCWASHFYEPSHPYHWANVIESPNDPATMVPLLRDPKQLIIAVAGGLGSHSGFCAFCPGWHQAGGLSVTRKIEPIGKAAST